MGKYIAIDAQTLDSYKQEASTRLASLRPWTDFFDRSRFSTPVSLAVFSSRLKFNADYFQNNYILIMLIMVLASN